LGPGFVDGTNITSHNKLFQKMVIRRLDIQQNGTQQIRFISNANTVLLSLQYSSLWLFVLCNCADDEFTEL
jgi:hypothetical protein